MFSSKPLMYAELLSNIRQISVIVALNEPCDLSTQVELSPDGRRFILHHGGDSSSLALPGQIPCTIRLPPPAPGSRELTWRLPLAGEPSRPSMDSMQVNVAPWAAKFLGPETEFVCRACGAVIVGKGSIAAWRDLPSENWAEMMDFWHCHKPDLPVEQVEHAAASRGYGSNAAFTPSPGIGFVDVSTFLLADIDCRNIQTASSLEEAIQYQNISCKACHSLVGYIDHQATGNRFYKWQLRSTQAALPLLTGASPSSSTSPSLATIISAQLASSIQSQGLSRFVLLPAQWMPNLRDTNEQFHNLSCSMKGSFRTKPPSATAPVNLNDLSSTSGNTIGQGQSHSSCHTTCLSLWVLAPSLRYSSNANLTKATSDPPDFLLVRDRRSGTPAMKVFWKALTIDTAENLVGSNGVEEMYLPVEAISGIKSCLQLSSLFLPPSARKFQDWDIGLLERYKE